MLTRVDILEQMKAQVTAPKQSRMYAGGLLPAFCEFLLSLDSPSGGFLSLQDLFRVHPQITSNKGRKVNQLSVRRDGNEAGRKVAIRGPYNAVETYYIHEHHRHGYKVQPAHATGQWHDYIEWLDAMATFSEADLIWLRDAAKEFMLSFLEEQVIDPSSILADPPIFGRLIADFPWNDRAKDEAKGAAFQAMVFAYIRADSPHLQVETGKLHAGSARRQGVGDVDAWEGARLVISAEVKHFTVNETGLPNLSSFFHKVRMHAAVGMVVAEDFGNGVREIIQSEGLHAVSKTDLARTVALWDPLKQRNALNAFEWAVVQKERTPGLTKRFRQFLADVDYRPLPASGVGDQ